MVMESSRQDAKPGVGRRWEADSLPCWLHQLRQPGRVTAHRRTVGAVHVWVWRAPVAQGLLVFGAVLPGNWVVDKLRCAAGKTARVAAREEWGIELLPLAPHELSLLLYYANRLNVLDR